MKAALITMAILKDSTVLNDNVDENILMVGLELAQEIHLQQIIGGNLYNTLIDKVVNGITDYNELITDYIQPFLKFQVLSETIIPLTFKFKTKGVVTNGDYNNGVSPISMKDATQMVNYYTDRATFFGNRLTDYLTRNRSQYPEYGGCIGLAPKRQTNIGIPLNKY